MAFGVFFLKMDDTGNILNQIIYLTDEDKEIQLGENELLRIRMRHSDKAYVLTIMPNYQIYSLKREIRIKRISHSIIVGVVLEPDEESSIYKESLSKLIDNLLRNPSENNSEIKKYLEEKFEGYFERPQIILDKKDLEKRLSDKVKKLNKSGKFDEAASLLEKIKKIPKKLYKAHDSAEKALKVQDFDKAMKLYEDARGYAKELGEKELVKMYQEKIHLTKKIPSLLKKRSEYLEAALNGLRNDQFGVAQRNFHKAAQVSEELLDARAAEEYSLKAKILSEYIKVDRKFHK